MYGWSLRSYEKELEAERAEHREGAEEGGLAQKLLGKKGEHGGDRQSHEEDGDEPPDTERGSAAGMGFSVFRVRLF